MDQTLEATLIVEDRGVDGGRLGKPDLIVGAGDQRSAVSTDR